MIPENVFHQILALGEEWQVRAVDWRSTNARCL